MIEQKDDGAFGFTFMDEDEIKAMERQLTTQVNDFSQNLIETKKKLDNIVKMMNSFLTKLAEDPDKTYIYWPQRSENVKDFQNKLNQIYSA